MADKTTSIGKPKEKPKPIEKPEEIYIPPEKRQQIIDDLRLFKKKIVILSYINRIYKNYKFT